MHSATVFYSFLYTYMQIIQKRLYEKFKEPLRGDWTN